VDVVFLDANVLFSAAYRTDSRIRRLWRLSGVRLVTSSYAVEEARRNLDSPGQRADLERLLRSVEVVPHKPAPRRLPTDLKLPEKDRPIVLDAIDAGASFLLTGDFKHFGQYYDQIISGVRILPPGEYLRRKRKRQ
jgi:predicted nucleic acid-binding protein